MISQVALSLADAVKAGAPDLYAQSASRFLAIHLLSKQNDRPDPLLEKRRSGTLGKHHLAHVLDYIKSYYAEPLSLDQLAGEASVSRFHFVRLFHERVGTTSHQYLVNVRMSASALLLSDTELDILEIALRCGYLSAAHFSAAFQKHFSQSPSLYRHNSREAMTT